MLRVSEYPDLPRAYRGPAVQAWTCERAAVIGDVHGRSALLDALMAMLDDRPMFFLGDLNDRGPDTRGVLDRLVRHDAKTVLGNHDLWLASLAAGEGLDDAALWPSMGGKATLLSYGIDWARPDYTRIPASHRVLLLDAPVAAKLTVAGSAFWLTHSGVPVDIDWGVTSLEHVVPHLAKNRPSEFIWHFAQPEEMLGVDLPVVMGHRPRHTPEDLGHVIAIDTGAGRRGLDRLTALLLPERRFVTVG